MQPKKYIEHTQKISHNLENPQTKFYQKISSGYWDITFFSTHPNPLKNPKIWTLKFEYLEFGISDRNFLLDYVLWSPYEHFSVIKKLLRFHFKCSLFQLKALKAIMTPEEFLDLLARHKALVATRRWWSGWRGRKYLTLVDLQGCTRNAFRRAQPPVAPAPVHRPESASVSGRRRRPRAMSANFSPITSAWTCQTIQSMYFNSIY